MKLFQWQMKAPRQFGTVRLQCVAFIMTAFVLYPSCSKTNADAKTERGIMDHGGLAAKMNAAMPYEEDSMDMSDPGNFFTLDYRAQEAEGAAESGKAALKAPIPSAKKKEKALDKKKRELKDYMTKYNEKLPQAVSASYTPASSSEKTSAAGKPFTVVDWGPQGAIPAQVRFPSFYVLFSEPVIPLAALGEVSDKSSFMTVTPAIKGVFRWKGTSLLTFDASQAADPMVQYTITVQNGTLSAAGKPLTGERVFTVQAAPLDIKWIALGKALDGGGRYGSYAPAVDMNDAPIEAAKTIRVRFNYAVKAEAIAAISKVETVKWDVPEEGDLQEKEYAFTVTQEKIDTVAFNIKEDFPRDTDVELRIKQPNIAISKAADSGAKNKASGREPMAEAGGRVQGARNEGYAVRTFHTLRPLSFVSYRCDYSSGVKSNPVYLTFNHPLDEKTVLPALSASNELAITKDNIEVNGNTITVFALDVSPHSKYTLTVSDTLCDVWGQPLAGGAKAEVTVQGMPSQARFAEGGAKMLEAQFPHRIIFEYQNATDPSRYKIAATDSPLSPLDWNNRLKDDALDNDEKAVTLDTSERDKRILKVVELDDYLINGKGAVRFDAAIKLPKEATSWDKSTQWTATNTTTVQVTDLGITARFGVNKAAALVTSLSTGRPIEGATVNIYHKSARHKTGEAKALGTAVTDKAGLAVIDIDSEVAPKLYRDDPDDPTDDAWYGSLVMEALISDGEKVTDRAIFIPDSHSSWRDGVEQASIKEAYSTKPRTFMFSDRGLYKPGETISFRGIDRDQKLGAFIPYKGSYKVELKSSSWRDEKVYAALTGEASEEGGFAGSFKTDGEMEPGGYQLVYTRDGLDAGKVVPVTVSFFERLRFQCGIQMPSAPVITGSQIGASLSASYLSGGVLQGADVTSRWYREPWYFTSTDAAFKGYKFGPNVSGSRQIVTNGKGTLDTNGTLQLSCGTTGEALAGVPYRYRLSCDVMDESNQSISCAGIAVVHPAACYLGVSGPNGIASFPKAGEVLSFNYKWATLDGAAADNVSAILGKGKNITVTLLRDEWNVIKQQGVSGYIYNRYEKSQVEESKTSVSAADSGKITVTPLKPGNHTLRLSATDAAGRDIITETTFYATGSGIVSWYSDDAAAIRLTPNKARYTPGETATLLLESPLPAGDYLITVEREGIFSQEVRHFEGNVQTIEVKVARNFLPVAYVCVSSYSVRNGAPKHQYGEIDIDKPKGYYGVAPIFIDPRVKSFSVKVESNRTFAPGEEAEVTLVATKGGKPLPNAELTLMAVDRGVLDLIDYHVEDPISFFYNSGNFPLRVFGGDSRSMLMDPVTYAVNNLAGGDALMKSAMAQDKLSERKDFNPTAAFIPVIKTDENGRAVCRFKLPDTLTTYRITAFGVKGELLSLQEDEIAVQNPINVSQVLPRRMRERDTAELGVLVTNLDSMAREVSVSLEFDTQSIADVEGVAELAGAAAVDGKAQKKATIESGDSEMITFDAAAIKAGAVNAVFTIKSDVLNERLVAPLTIERPYIYETVTTIGTVSEKDGKKSSAQEQAVIPAMADDGRGSLTVTLDATRLGLLGGAVQYLFDYPFGCMEQQASKLLPLVAFEEYIDVFGLNCEVKNIKKCVKSVFKGLKQSQLPSGGFGYWPDARYPDLYVSTRIAHVAALALDRGYSQKDLSISIDALAEYMEKAIGTVSSNAAGGKGERGGMLSPIVDGYSRAYVLYVLSLLGRKAPLPDLKRLCKGEDTGISILSFSGMAALKQGAQKKDETAKKEQDEKEELSYKEFAAECAKRIRSFIRPTAQGADLTDPRGNSNNWWCFYDGNSERLALAMQLFTMLDKDDEMIGRLLFSLMSAQRCGYWQSTAQTARVLDAFHTLIKAQNIDATNLTASASLGKTKLLDAAFKGAAAKPVTVTEDFAGNALKKCPRDKLLPLTMTRSGKGNLYYTASLRYAIPEERQTARDEGICVSAIIYDNTTGEELKAGKGSTVINLEAGKTYRMTLDISTTYDRAYLALRAPIPSGAEILDATFVTTSDEARNPRVQTEAEKERADWEGTYYGGYHWLTQRLIRDNEVQFFYDRFGRGHDTVEFVFRAVRSGVYPTPPAAAECMYEPEVFGRTSGTLFVVK